MKRVSFSNIEARQHPGISMADERIKEKIAELEQELVQARAREKALGDLLEKKLNEIYVHYHISRAIGSALDLQEMLRQVFDIIKKSLPLDRISVYLLDEHREKIELVFYSGLDLARQVALPVGEGTPGRIVRHGEHIHIHDLSLFYETFNDFIHHPGEDKRDGSYLGVALKAHDTVIGVIGMDNSTKYGLSVDDMDFMALLSHQLAAGIERSRLFETIRQMSQRDGLTGLYNHRMFKEKLLHEISRRARKRTPLSLMMLDIDHFKQFNDDFGHQAGDAVLKDLTEIISGQTRCGTIDICCRYGGEEFAVIMPELELTHAVTVAERLRKAVENAVFLVGGHRSERGVTVSLGVACVAENEDMSPHELIKKADEALYLSKRNGRNRVSAG